MNEKLEALRQKWKKALAEERRLQDDARALSRASGEARTAVDAAHVRQVAAYEELVAAIEAEP